MWGIYTRYQYRTAGLVEWTKWYVLRKFETEQEAKDNLGWYLDMSKQVDKATKLKHEFEIKKIDD